MLGKRKYSNGQKVYELSGENLTYFFKDGSIKAEGKYKKAKREGQWVFFHESGVVWQHAHYTNDKKDGLWITYDTTGQIISEEVYKDGILKKDNEDFEIDGGRMNIFYSDGSLKAEGPFVDEKREGEWTFFYENGVIKTHAHYREGQKDGLWITYDREGKIVSEDLYVIGEIKE